MTENTILVIAAVVDTKQLTLYMPTGEKVYISQGDPRLARIINEITPILSAGRGAVAEVNLYGDATTNTYSDYETQSGGFVKLFRVAKKALKGFFGSPAAEPTESTLVNPQVIGHVPPPVGLFVDKTPVRAEAEFRAKLNQAAIQQILAHAETVPASSPEFNDKDTGDKGESTVVAIVGDQVIENMEALKPQMARAVSLGSSKGMDAFMRRLQRVAASARRHSVQDLLKFLEKGDLPIADDGSIIIYKILRKRDDHYVDCHTGKVPQKVGSYVHMDASLVDHNRTVECSNGLHVARRGYLSSFSGDVVVLAKVAPEDVIAVPEYDPNKMRVCGYHILFELSDDDFRKLRGNQPFTDNSQAQMLLGRALAGDHPALIETVCITEHQGGGVVITPTAKAKAAGTKQEAAPVVTPAEALTNGTDELAAPAVDPKAVSKQVAELKAAIETRAQKAQRLYVAFVKAESTKDIEACAKELLDHKKSTKLGWKALGLTAGVDQMLKPFMA